MSNLESMASTKVTLPLAKMTEFLTRANWLDGFGKSPLSTE